MKKFNFLADTLQNPPNPDKLLPLISFVFNRDLKVVQFLDKVKLLRRVPFETVNKPTDVTFKLLTQ